MQAHPKSTETKLERRLANVHDRLCDTFDIVRRDYIIARWFGQMCGSSSRLSHALRGRGLSFTEAISMLESILDQYDASGTLKK